MDERINWLHKEENRIEARSVSALTTDSLARKKIPIATGVVDYFPLALAAVAELSRVGNEKHNKGQPLYWNRPLSADHADTLMRHFIERGTVDADGIRHSTKVAWRALAILQLELEAARVSSSIAPGVQRSALPPRNLREWLEERGILDEERIVTMQAHDDLHNDHEPHPGLAIVPFAAEPGGHGEGAL